MEKINSLRTKALLVAVCVLASVGLVGGVASAQTVPADPLGGGMADMVGSVTVWVMTIGVPGLLALLGLGILIRLGTRWLKRAARAV